MNSKQPLKINVYHLLKREEIEPGIYRTHFKVGDDVFTYISNQDNTSFVLEKRLDNDSLKPPIRGTENIESDTEAYINSLELNEFQFNAEERTEFCIKYTELLNEISGDFKKILSYSNERIDTLTKLGIRKYLENELNVLPEKGEDEKASNIINQLWSSKSKYRISPSDYAKLYALFTAEVKLDNKSSSEQQTKDKIKNLELLINTLIKYKLTNFTPLNNAIYNYIATLTHECYDLIGDKLDKDEIIIPTEMPLSNKLKEIENKYREHDLSDKLRNDIMNN